MNVLYDKNINLPIHKKTYGGLCRFVGVIADFVIDVVYTISGQDAFFRDDYNHEVSSLFNSLIYFDNQHQSWIPIPSDGIEIFKTITTTYDDSWRRLLQHVYTHDKSLGPRICKLIKTSAKLYKEKKHKDAKHHFKQFMLEFYRLKSIYCHDACPDFGACDKCVKNLRFARFFAFSKTSKHAKTLQEKNDSFWRLDWE